jgi:hypothetical protein
MFDYLRLVSKDDGYWLVGPRHCGHRAGDVCVLRASSLVGMQEVSSTATRAYRWVVIHLDIAVEAGRDEVEALRWSLTSIG